ncbi:MAG: tetratricopeptide repeat protein [Bacteroidales bacterium]|jgi:tetratricopeptide (TPR) repeat protein|nr:tetratricopeptide repeat protein [Bacteroidales bacterium]
MKKVIFLIFSISTVFYVNAQENDSLIVKANDYYVNGKYQDAISIYESILNSGYESPDLHYNIANAYYKQNIVAQAILYYEKALQLAPNDDDINYNLELVNRLVIDKIEVLPVFFITGWIRSLQRIFTSNLWAIISLVSFILALIFISMYLYSRNLRLKKLSFGFAFFIVIVFTISLVFSYQQKHAILRENTAIVTSPSVTVKSSPDESGTDLFVVHEGTKVSIEDKISDWNEIKLSDGSKGWLKTENIEVI